MALLSLLKRSSSSLLGHIALFEIVFSLPFFLYFLHQHYLEDTLTVEWAIYLAVIWAVGGAVVAGFVWFTVSLGLIKRQRGRK